MLENKRSLQKLVSEVSKHSDVKSDVCDKVIRATIDVIGADIAKNGKARIPYIMTVESFEHSGTSSSFGDRIQPSVRLSAKLSPTLRKLFQRAQKENLDITPKNWRSFLYSSDRESVAHKPAKTTTERTVVHRVGNPFLYD